MARPDHDEKRGEKTGPIVRLARERENKISTESAQWRDGPQQAAVAPVEGGDEPARPQDAAGPRQGGGPLHLEPRKDPAGGGHAKSAPPPPRGGSPGCRGPETAAG